MSDVSPPPPETEAPPVPPTSSGSPTDFLKGVVGKRVIVRLTSGIDYRGALGSSTLQRNGGTKSRLDGMQEFYHVWTAIWISHWSRRRSMWMGLSPIGMVTRLFAAIMVCSSLYLHRAESDVLSVLYISAAEPLWFLYVSVPKILKHTSHAVWRSFWPGWAPILNFPPEKDRRRWAVSRFGPFGKCWAKALCIGIGGSIMWKETLIGPFRLTMTIRLYKSSEISNVLYPSVICNRVLSSPSRN